MKKRLLFFLLGFVLLSVQVIAQQKTITGKVSSAADGSPLPGISVLIKGTSKGTQTDGSGNYSITADVKEILVFQSVGFKTVEKTVGNSDKINVSLQDDAQALGEVVVTALGIKQEKRALGSSVTEVKGDVIANAQRENFVNSLQGRVAGLTVNSTSGMPGASSSVIIRGINSLSGSNQPLFIVDGLPIDNKSMNTSRMASDKPGSTTATYNRQLDYTNRGADISPNDIESVTVLKGPEASALYGIDAASGAIVITTKRGKAGQTRVNYSNDFRLDQITKYPEVQQVYAQGTAGVTDNTVFTQFGQPYAAGTQLYNNIKPFFKDAFTQRHNLSVDGGSDKATYRASLAYTNQEGFVPNTALKRINLGLSAKAEVSKYVATDLSFNYINDDNDQVFKGDGGPMLGLLIWPSVDNAQVYLNPDGTRKFINPANTKEYENPYFNVSENYNKAKTNRILSNLGLTITPLRWLKFVGNFGFDIYSTENQVLRSPQSGYAYSYNGILDDGVNNTKNFNIQYYASADKKFGKFSTSLKVGSAVNMQNSIVTSVEGTDFQEPGFTSINNTRPSSMRGRTDQIQRRLVGVFGMASMNYDDMVYLNVTGRNDWTSTLPLQNRSFFYPSASMSFIFTELGGLKNNSVLSFGKLKASVAQVGKDAESYSIYPALETQLTTGAGFAYGFTAPSPYLKPEKTTSYEFGTELKFFQNRLGVDVAVYNSQSVDQIIKDLRMSYGTGFILAVRNGGKLKNQGIEIQLNGTPIKKNNFTWDILANFTKTSSELQTLPNNLAEYYVSDTWVYANVRNGAVPGQSMTTLTGFDYQRNKNGEVLVDPKTGLPLRDQSKWVPVGDRNPDFAIGLSNSFNYKNWNLSFLFDIRKGGDIWNATEYFMTINGLSKNTLNRTEKVVINGVLKDGKENSDAPTKNTMELDPMTSSAYWSQATGAFLERDFIEKDINWIRMKELTLGYTFPQAMISHLRGVKSLSLFASVNDLFMITNYKGLDPVVNGNSAAVGGSGAAGFDYGNFPLPRGFNFGLKLGL